ncbi:MAG TPA: FAD-dependent oxidoreductase [bacterium]|nr:FAD-dependent oxidoreductase [bacterium]
MRTPVLVVGGTPAGVAAAVAAARTGMPVYLTESRPFLGGDLTGPMLNVIDLDRGLTGGHLAQGVFLEIYKRLGMTFDVETAKRVFLDEVRGEPLITLKMRTTPVDVLMRGPWVTGVTFEDAQHEQYTICATRVVDATDDADVAAMAGAPYTIGREDSGIDRAMMSATLVFELRGVNWRQVVTYVDGRSAHHVPHIGKYGGNVWGYHHIMALYKPVESGIAIYDLNVGLQNRQTVLINGLLVFGVDGTSPASVADGLLRAKAEVPRLIRFLRERAPGFADAVLVRTADYLYVRETRHIRGLYTMTAGDIVNGRVFWDAIGVASYPIDIHPYKPDELNPYAPKRYVYTVPFRALVPRRIANLIMASRSISATYTAAASLRVVPTTMEEGQAAGIAAVISIRRRVSVPQLAERPALIYELQAGLHDQGAFLPSEMPATAGRDGLPSAKRLPLPAWAAPY